MKNINELLLKIPPWNKDDLTKEITQNNIGYFIDLFEKFRNFSELCIQQLKDYRQELILKNKSIK